MESLLKYSCSLAEDMLDIPVTVLTGSSAMESFCSRFRFHPVQRFLFPSSLETLLQAMRETDLVCLTDPLHMSFHFFMTEDTPVCFGPYCIDTLSPAEATVLFRQLEIPTEEIKAFLAYRSQFQQITEQRVLNHIYGLIHHISPTAQPHQLRRIGYEERAFIVQRPTPEKELPYAQVIQERYGMEENLKNAVKTGNYTAALKTMRALVRDVEYLLTIGNRDKNMVTAMTIMGTELRLYAVDAGLSPLLIDQITGHYMEKQQQEKSADGLIRIIEDLLKAICKEVQKSRYENMSSIAQSIRYYIEKHYNQEISLARLAEDLDISYNYMIAHFKEQTGMTPGAYINEVRLQNAQHLLTNSSKTISQISMEVGIPDSNYFAKLFKRKYGVTPGQYRKQSS